MYVHKDVVFIPRNVMKKENIKFSSFVFRNVIIIMGPASYILKRRI